MNVKSVLLTLPLVIISILTLGQPVFGMGGIGGGGSDLVIVPGPMKSPMRITAMGKAKYVTTDYQGRKVYRIDPADPDHPQALFEIEGNPFAIEVVRNQFVIGNDSAGTIEIFKRHGRRGYQAKTFRAEGPIQASDITYDQRMHQLFVVDSLNHEVKVFTENGQQLRAFGTAGPLVDPKGIAIDTRLKEVFVTDYGDEGSGIDASIQVYDYAGQLLRSITGNFSRPQGIAVNANRIFLVDAMLGQVLVFDRGSSALIATLGNFGVAAGELLLPMDVHLDANTGQLLVTNNRLGKVTIFNAAGL